MSGDCGAAHRSERDKTRLENRKRCTGSIDPEMKDCYESVLGVHDARPIICPSDEDAEWKTHKK